MKLFKSIAIRATALLLFFAMISAVILWQAGVYDISFIKRPEVITTEGGQGDDTDMPEATTKPFEGTLPSGDEEQIKEILNSIQTLDEVKALGYELSYSVFAPGSVLAKIDMPYIDGVYSHRFQNISKNVFYTKENGRPAIKVQNDIKAIPRIQFYYGYALIDNGKTYDIYSPDGKALDKGFDGTLVYARSSSGYPVVKKDNKFYHIDPEKGLTEIKESEVKYKALAFDQPRYYGVSDIGLYPFAAEVDIFTYVGPVPTEPQETTPGETTQGGTGSDATQTTPDGTTGSDAGQTTPDSTIGSDVTQTTPDGTTEVTPGETTPGTTAGETEGETTTESEEQTTTEEKETEAESTTVPSTTEEPDETEGRVELEGAELQNNEAEGDTPDATTTEGAATPEGSTTPEGTTTPEGSTTPEGTTTPEGSTTPEGTTTPEGSTTPEGTTTPEDSTTPEDTEELKPVNGTVIKDGAYYKVTKGIRYGYKDKDGNVVIEPQFAMAYEFTPEGFAIVRDTKNNLYFINKNGTEVITIRNQYYAYPAEFSKKKLHQRYTDGINMNIEDVGMYYYDSGFCMIRYVLMDPYSAKILYKSENVLLNSKGQRVPIPGKYELENYSDGVMLLSKNKMYGYMSTDMSWICPAIFTEAEPYIQGLAVAQLDGKYGMIDRDGNTVLPFCFKYISNVSDGRIAAYSDELGWQLYAVAAKPSADSDINEDQGVTSNED